MCLWVKDVKFDKNKKEVLRYAKINDQQLDIAVKNLTETLENSGVIIVVDIADFDVLVPSKIIQNLIRSNSRELKYPPI